MNKKNITINPSFLILLTICLFGGFLEESLILLTMLSMHEIGHLTFIFIFKNKIEKINITAIGCFIEIEKKHFQPFYEKLLISLGGILMNFVVILFSLIIKNDLSTFIIKVNFLLIVTNILPIYPLDGFQIIFNIMTLFYDDEYVIDFLSIISYVFIAVISIVSFIYRAYGFMVISALLAYKTFRFKHNSRIISLKNRLQFRQKFLN